MERSRRRFLVRKRRFSFDNKNFLEQWSSLLIEKSSGLWSINPIISEPFGKPFLNVTNLIRHVFTASSREPLIRSPFTVDHVICVGELYVKRILIEFKSSLVLCTRGSNCSSLNSAPISCNSQSCSYFKILFRKSRRKAENWFRSKKPLDGINCEIARL